MQTKKQPDATIATAPAEKLDMAAHFRKCPSFTCDLKLFPKSK